MRSAQHNTRQREKDAEFRTASSITRRRKEQNPKTPISFRRSNGKRLGRTNGDQSSEKK